MPNLTCSIDGCEKKHLARGWCDTHYMRNRKHGSPHANFGPKRKVRGICIAEGCELEDRGVHGYCSRHAQAWRKHGDPLINKRSTGRKTCTIEGCEKFVDGIGLCSMHWARNKKTGSPHIVRQVPAWDKSPHWRGSGASYSAIHQRLAKLFGKAEDHSCTDCGGMARHWSYDLKDPDQLIDPALSLAYSAKPEHYAPRCVSCHSIHDRQN